jgi:hypoxanthine phosphoribosyltransferase
MTQDIQKVLFEENVIHERLDQLSVQINQKYLNKELTVICILNGSLIFAADLIRRIQLPLQIDCWSVSSYHGTKSSGQINFRQSSVADVTNRHVLLVDDIFDTGLTLTKIKSKIIKETKALSVECCVLLRKNVKRNTELIPEYVGFDIPNEFVIGYGLDYNEKYRNLPFIGTIKPELI